MLDISDLADICGLFVGGMMVGGLLTFIPAIIGYATSSLVSFFKKG